MIIRLPIREGHNLSNVPRLERIIDEVADELSRAQLYLSVAFALNEKYREGRITSARYLSYGSYYAALREGLLSVSKLLIHDQDSISIVYLLDYALSNPREYGHSESDEVKAMVRWHNVQIKGLEDLAERLRPIRDMVLAHLDRNALEGV